MALAYVRLHVTLETAINTGRQSSCSNGEQKQMHVMLTKNARHMNGNDTGTTTIISDAPEPHSHNTHNTHTIHHTTTSHLCALLHAFRSAPKRPSFCYGTKHSTGPENETFARGCWLWALTLTRPVCGCVGSVLVRG